MFEPTDYAGLSGSTTTLSCSRDADKGRMVFETINFDGEVQTVISDSSDDDIVPGSGYDLVQNGNDFTLTITITVDTAILTKCSITESGKLSVESTAMIYLVG